MIAKALRNKIAWSTIVQLLGRGIHIAIGIVIVKLITNTIGPEQFGLYGKVSEYAFFFAVAANLGIFGNTVRKMSEKPKDGELFFNALLLRIITAVLIFAGSFLYTVLFIQNAIFQMALLYILASLLFEFVSSVCNASLQANYWMGRATFASLMGRGFELLVVIFLSSKILIPSSGRDIEPILSGSEYPLFFLAPLAAAALAMSLHLMFTRLRFKWVWKINTEYLKLLFITALPFGIINIINNLYFRFIPSYIANENLTNAEFGTYGLSLGMASTAALLSTFLMFSTLPALKKSLSEGHHKRAKELYKTAQKILLFFAPLTVIGGALLGPFAIKLVSNQSFVLSELWLTFVLLFSLAAVSFFYDLILITLFALEEDMWLLKRELIALTIGSSSLLITFFYEPSVQILNFGLFIAIAAISSIIFMGHRKINQSWKTVKEVQS